MRLVVLGGSESICTTWTLVVLVVWRLWTTLSGTWSRSTTTTMEGDYG